MLPKSFWRTYAPHMLATVALLLVFWLYTQPEFLVLLADQVWSCF